MIVRIAGRNPACHAICHAMQVKKPGGKARFAA
jgi:hypothetical protein